MPNVNQSLRDRVVRHELYLKRLANEEVRRTRELLVAAEADIQRQIERRMAWIAERGFDSSPFTLRRLEANLKEVRAVVRAAHRELGAQLRSSLLGVAKHEASWAADAVAGELAGVGVELGVGVAEGPLLSAIVNKQPFQGALLKDWAAKLGEDTFHAVRGAVRQGLLQGEAIGDIVRRLRGTKANDFKDGVLAIRRRNAEAVVRTAVSSVANSAREATWKANDDLVKGVQWVSTLDDRTTPQCQIRDGLEYTLDYEPRGHSVPWGDGPGALHWNCRSTSVPVLATWKELGIDAREVTGEQRAALDGMVPSTQNFGEWLGHMRDQGRLGLVEEVLGKKRAAAFMAGEIKFKDLFNAQGDFLTLDQLKLADPGRAATLALVNGGKELEKLAAQVAASVDAELAAIGSGKITESRELGTSLNAVRRVTVVDDDGNEFVGYWKPAVDSHGFAKSFLKGAGGTQADREVFAYELDQKLGLGLVRPTTYRTVGGTFGTIQAEAPFAETLAMSDPDSIGSVSVESVIDLGIFDVLIANGDRHFGNVMIGDGGELWAIDNGLTMTAPGARLRFDAVEELLSMSVSERDFSMSPEHARLWLSRLESDELLAAVWDSEFFSAKAKQYAQNRIDRLVKLISSEDWRGLYRVMTASTRY